jgi:AbrB family looped-hinge helix DNA binding protein
MEREAKKQFSWDDHFFGSVTVGERGQVVIPADARKRFGIEAGDKMLIMSGPGEKSLMLCKLDSLREFMASFQEGLMRVEQDMAAPGAGMADTPTPAHEEDEKSR